MTSDLRLIGSGTGVADIAGVALAPSWVVGAMSRGLFLQAARASQTKSTALNKRIKRFDSIPSLVCNLGIARLEAGEVPQERKRGDIGFDQLEDVDRMRRLQAPFH